jgi:hypothetical protein
MMPIGRRISAKEARALLASEPKPNKYRAKAVTVDNIRFASTTEYKRYCQLKLLEMCGKIQNLACQPKFTFSIDGKPLLFPNGRQAAYTGDFQYCEPGRGLVVEDVKSSATKTEAYALRTALFRALYPKIVFIETGKGAQRGEWIARKIRQRAA